MSSTTLRLTLTGRRFSLTPLPGHLVSGCTGGPGCPNVATHRLLSRDTASVRLMCDAHTLEWAAGHGYTTTTARLAGDSLASA